MLPILAKHHVDQFHFCEISAPESWVNVSFIELAKLDGSIPSIFDVGSEVLFGIRNDYAQHAPRQEHTMALGKKIRHFFRVVEMFDEVFGEDALRGARGKRQAPSTIEHQRYARESKTVNIFPPRAAAVTAAEVQQEVF